MKWRNFAAARNGECLRFAIQQAAPSFWKGLFNGRIGCPNTRCEKCPRRTRSVDFVKCVTYCHNCKITMDALELLTYYFSCELWQAYDILEAEKLLDVDLLEHIG